MDILEINNLRQVVEQLSIAGNNVIIFYHPLCRDATLRVFIFNSITKPLGTTVIDYTIQGKELTQILQNNTMSVHRINVLSNALSTQIENLPTRTYKFSSNFAFEEFPAG